MSYQQKICVPKKTEDINVKALNIITDINEAKATTKHISCDCKCKFNSTKCNSNQKWNNKTCQSEWKNYRKHKKNYSCNPSTCTGDNSKYLIIISDDLKIVYDEIISVMDILSTKMTNTISTNATSTASINCHSEKTRYKIHCYILHTALLVIILLLIITIICYHYAKHRSKQKNIDALTP